MSRLIIKSVGRERSIADGLYADLGRRIAVAPPGTCPVDMALGFLSLCHAQSCGKCVPCRVGVEQLEHLLTDILRGKGTPETLDVIQRTAEAIYQSADCAIGYDAAKVVLSSLKAFHEDYISHIQNHRCKMGTFETAVPCMSLCPANVDVPGYLSLIRAGRPADAVRLIRKDNPFPTACAYICEHPCEDHCRRKVLDDAVNIRGLKRYAVDAAGKVAPPICAPATGKAVAIIGGGPSGLSAAYYLALMGHQVTLFERRKKLGGMLRYGIPAYRLPRELLDQDIEAILATGVEARTNVELGVDFTYEQLMENYDSVLMAIGAHAAARLNIEGEDAEGVETAVDLLRGIGDDEFPDFTGKNVVVVGGGNVAMDATRTSIRLGAAKVTCVYRRRREDMTALPDEVEGAMAEGAEIMTLKAPVRIETDEAGHAAALWVQPQIIGLTDQNGRTQASDAALPQERLAADIIIVAIGQKTETEVFEKAGLPIKRGTLSAMPSGQVFSNGKLFASGECATKPASAIRAIISGKVAAANIDEYLGYFHQIGADVDIPDAPAEDWPVRGRINTTMREAAERKQDFACIECGMTEEEALAESSRCLRCDHYGCGAFKGGRVREW